MGSSRMQASANRRGRRRLAHIAALVLCAALPHAVHAQAPPPGVFTEVQTAIAPRINPALEPATVRSRVVQVDTRKITAARRSREVLKLNLFDDATVEVDINRVRPTRTGYFIAGAPKGKARGEVRLVVNGPVVVGTIETPESRFTIRSAGQGRHVIRQIDPAKEIFECEVREAPIYDPSTLPAISSLDSPIAGAISVPDIHAEDLPTEDGSEVRVLIVYTRAVQANQGGPAGIRALIDLFIASANQAFEDGGINPRLVLAHSAMVDYAGESPSIDLERLRAPDDGYMDQVHSLRNEHAADLVHLLTDAPTRTRGIAYLLQRESLFYEQTAFALSAEDSEKVFTHEIGHNFGVAHDRYVHGSLRAIYPYAYGYVNDRAFDSDASPDARWYTVMGYNDRCSDAGFNCERLLRFANPDQNYRGDPLGVSADSPATGLNGPADARLTLNNTARWVGSMRSEACSGFTLSTETPIAPVGGGELSIRVETALGCLWKGSSQSDFVTVASDGRSAGPDFLRLQIEENETGAERRGTVTVAGKTIEVLQLAVDEGICARTSSVASAIARGVAGLGGADRCDEVGADELASLRRLDLSRSGIRSLKPGDFDGLTGLEQLDLSRNFLTELPEGLFSDLSELQELRLNRNQLKHVPEGLLAGLSKLRIVTFEVNRITDVPPRSFAGLSSLETLILGFNRLTEVDQGWFSDLSNLTIFSVSNNKLTALPDGIFDGLPNLESLSLQYNAFSELPASLLAGLYNLQWLQLQNNQLTDLHRGFFAGLAKLEYLDLSFNELSNLPEDMFAQLSSLEELRLNSNELTELPADLFRDQSSLKILWLGHNRLTELSAGLFFEVGNLEELYIESNDLIVLPASAFRELSRLKNLWLSNNRLAELPEGLFSGLSDLEKLSLYGNSLLNLSANTFSGLSSLEALTLARNNLSSLPYGLFSGLSMLDQLSLQDNRLTSVPDGIFSGLSNLEQLHLHENPVDPIPLALSLQKVDEGQFKAVVPSGAPFGMELSFSVSDGGVFQDDANKVSIATGVLESEPRVVDRASKRLDAVSVNFGPLPNLPVNHRGYEFIEDESLPLLLLESINPEDAMLQHISLSEGNLSPEFSADIKRYEAIVANSIGTLTVGATTSNADAVVAFLDANEAVLADTEALIDGFQAALLVGENTINVRVRSGDGTTTDTYVLVITRDGPGNVCVRSEEVKEAILAGIAGVEECGDLTREHLSSIRTLDLSDRGITSLEMRDFAGLDSLSELNLEDNQLHSLPEGIFTGLNGLTRLWLTNNSLSELRTDVFSGLTALRSLRLGRNELLELPSGVFYGLEELTGLNLDRNYLSSLPMDVFSGLAELRSLRLDGNDLTDLPAGVFADLKVLQQLLLGDNSLTGLRADMFSGLVSLRELNIGENFLTGLPAGLFDELATLERLLLGWNDIRNLPDGVFSGLTKLRDLGLYNNSLTELSPDVFSGLHALEYLNLNRNEIGELPDTLFAGQTSLKRLFLGGNRLTELPDGIFSGLTMLSSLDLGDNARDPLPITVSLEKAGDSRFRATAPAGAPFDLELSVSVNAAGVIEGSASSVTIPAGALVSTSLGVMRLEGIEEAVAVDIRELPGLPEDHEGYVLQADGSLPVVIIPAPRLPAPAQVTGLEVLSSVEQLNVTWNKVADADGYKVQWKAGDEDYADDRQALIAGVDSPSYTITGLMAGTEYTVRVIATRENADDGPPSSEVSGTPSAMPASQVQDVVVTPEVGHLDVSWAAVSDADGYKVQWKSGEQEYDKERQSVVSGGETVGYTIAGLDAGTEYSVRVIATRDDAEDGTPSQDVTGVPKASRPSQVTGVTVTVGVGQLQVSWDAISNANGYQVQWKSGEEEFDESRQADVSGGETTSHTIPDLDAGTEYTVRVIATKEHADEGVASEEVTGKPRAQSPAQVTGVELTSDVEQLEVSWTAVSDADGYKVQWKSGEQEYDEARQGALIGRETASYTIADLIPGTEYAVRVIATRAHADDGDPSDEVTGIPKAEPPAQVTGVAVAPGFEELQVSWDAVFDASGYKVQWKSGSQEYDEARQVALLGSGTTSYTIIDLITDTEYTIRIIATKDHADDGEPSEEVTGTPASPDPDVNSDGTLDGDDAQVMYQAYASEEKVGDGETGGTEESRRTLLSGLAGTADPSDDDLKAMLRKANVWRSVGLAHGGDINEDGAIDGDDAFVMYYAYEFADLVGNGETGGTARHRQHLLASRAGKDDPSDEDLKRMLRRANKLKEDFG